MACSRLLPALLFLGGLVGLRGQQAIRQCPGSVAVRGVGDMSLVAAQWNQPGVRAAPVQTSKGSILPEMWGRAYFAESCTAGAYNHSAYAAIPLLGKKLTYTTDLSQAGCGCNAALYLVVMRPNGRVSGCQDYYCDANSVCQVNCDEIDIQEANKFAFHSALHKEYDGNGISQGYGGFTEGGYAFDQQEYGPGAKCIDTKRPFQVAASFPKGSNGRLRALEVTLTQEGSPCAVSLSLSQYNNDPGFEHLSRSLAEGMTPVVSYWQNANMLWLDGPGSGGRGPCQSDAALECGTAPQFSSFSVEDLSVGFI